MSSCFTLLVYLSGSSSHDPFTSSTTSQADPFAGSTSGFSSPPPKSSSSNTTTVDPFGPVSALSAHSTPVSGTHDITNSLDFFFTPNSASFAAQASLAELTVSDEKKKKKKKDK